ncbi:hypothetical protein [Phenylobacterium sp.]|uniref:hypothetical protein n=1 Tax=Phenylobacterium sp. TaxID=1871053 RepID=UPI002FDA3B9F
MRSLAQVEPDIRRVVVAADGPIPELEGLARVLPAAETGAPLSAMSVYYDALELNTAIKPHAFRQLLAEPGVGSVTYLDPDICVYAPLAQVRSALARAPLALIPHLTRPLAGEASPNDLTILTSGGFNLGFMAARREAEIFALLDWWADKCRFDCRVDFRHGLFTDQKWMDLAPGLVSDLAVLRDPGLNTAYWNLEGRTLTRGGAGWQVNGQPLGFFHFSGFDPKSPAALSKHQDRIVTPPGSPLAELLADYAEALLENGHGRASLIPYAYGRFPSGRRVTPAMRRRALRAAREGEGFEAGLTAAVEAWMDGAEPLASAPGLPDISREMDQAWRDDPWAAARFDRADLGDRLALHAWFCDRPETEAASRQAAERLLAHWRQAQRTPAPWPQADAPWTGEARDVAAWLAEPAEGALPRPLAALWSARSDLRARFSEAAETGLFAWLAGPEAQAGRFSPALLNPGDLRRLAQGGEALMSAARFAHAPGQAPTALKLRLSAGYGVGVRAGWSPELLQMVRGDGDRPVSSLGGPFPFPRMLLWIWESRADLQRRYPIHRASGRLGLLRWLLGGGLAEYDIEMAGLPESLRNRAVFAATRLSLRNRPPRPAGETRPAKAAAIVAVERRTPDMAHWPEGALVFDAGAARLVHPDGGPVGAAQADLLVLATGPQFAPADTVALLSQQARWDHVAGAWPASALKDLPGDHPAWGFVDEVWSDRMPEHPTPRVVRLLSAEAPLQAQLAGLICR